MKTVPSLIASSTIGVAAVGLALGKPESSRPHSKRQRVGDGADLASQTLERPSLSTRPSTSLTILMDDEYSQAFLGGIPTTPSTKCHRRPPLPQLDTQKYDDKQRPESVQPTDEVLSGEPPDEDNKRESLSSRGSWMRRLSALPLSYSSISHATAASEPSSQSDSYKTKPSGSMSKPMLQFRNKLVKRNKPARASSGLEASQTFRSKFATIRRPATSHQRSILQQEHFEDYTITKNETSADTCLNPSPSLEKNSITQSRFTWYFYFEAKPLMSTMERTSGKSSDGKISDTTTMGKRILIDKNKSPTLVKPDMIVSFNSQDTACHDNESYGGEDPSDEDLRHFAEINPPEVRRLQSELPKNSQHSASIQIGSPTSWISRSRSLRGLRKDVNNRVRGRCSSVPLCVPSSRSNESADSVVKKKRAALLPMFQKDLTINTKVNNLAQSFSSNHSTQTQIFPLPLIPVYQLSSLSDDLARIGLSSPSTVILGNSSNRNSYTPDTAREPHTPFSSSFREPLSISNCFPPKDSLSSQINEVVDRASTLVGSDFDVRCLVSSEEDDTDFQSETIFDSLRSGVTDSIRSHNPLLDSIFDETPSTSDKYQRHKRCSVHVILKIDQLNNESYKKNEESAGIPTDGKDLDPYLIGRQELCSSVCVGESMSNTTKHTVFPRSTSVGKPTRSIHAYDDDEDEDWTKDDYSSDASKKELWPNFRESEGIIPGFQKTRFIVPSCNVENSTAQPEVPKNNVFDWSEPSSINRSGQQGGPPRPRTAHVKQMMDGRGGRALGRRGPSALHIRSQSVPVVPDLDATKLTSKFGTWGLGTKAISEDWDGDFEFDNIEPASSIDGVTSGGLNGVLVPEAIKASQENIVGHVSQIREVCLLVEDLKRLRLLGKSQGLLDGEFAPLWQQAEGIIALAAPVEDEKFETNDQLLPAFHNTTPNFGDDGLLSFPEGEIKNHRDSLDLISNTHVSPNGLSSQSLKSAFSFNDEDFGTNSTNHSSKVPLNLSHSSSYGSSCNSTTEVARKVMESIHQQRSSSDPLIQSFIQGSGSKMPFDTTTLKDLVHCAATLSRTLGDAVRAADCHLSNIESTRKLDSSPAFTRVFTDPTSRPPKNLTQSPGSNSNLNKSINMSSNRNLTRHMHIMAV